MLIDDLTGAGVLPRVPDAVIKIDNVMEYVKGLGGSGKMSPGHATVASCLIPPFETTWFEFKPLFADVKNGDILKKSIKKCGCLSMRFDLDRITDKDEFISYFSDKVMTEFFDQSEWEKVDPEEAAFMKQSDIDSFKNTIYRDSVRFVVGFRWYLEFFGVPLLLNAYAYALDKNGMIDVDGETDKKEKCVKQGEHLLCLGLNGFPATEAICNEFGVEMLDALNWDEDALCMAIGLTHCKNVSIIPVDLEPKLVKARRKTNNLYFERYHTLQIEPMKKIIDAEKVARGGSLGIVQALHICRGHFKDYGEKGLFGRLKGTYWWSNQVRGNADTGTVHKTYSVKEV